MCPADGDGLDIELDDDDDWEEEEQNTWDDWVEGQEGNSTQEEKKDAGRSGTDGGTADGGSH